MRILVVGEGKDELGGTSPGPLATLVLGLLGNPDDCQVEQRAFGALPKLHRDLPQKRGHVYARKVKVALLIAAREGFAALFLAHDRDRNPQVERDVRGAATALQAEGSPGYRYPPAAVGVAIETFDAWMLADERALTDVLGMTVQRQPDPETLDGKEHSGRHPKDRMEQLVAASDAASRARHDVYADIAKASRLRLDVIERRCPKGFGRFAKDVRAVGAALGLPTEPGGEAGRR